MIQVDPSKCIGCNACIRICPVPNANRYDGNVVMVNTDECIRCGECIRHCLHGARYYDDDLETVLKLMKSQRVSFLVAPAIKTAMDGRWRHVLQWLKNNGAHEIYDGAFGADICTYMHIKYLEQHPGQKIISQPCAAIVNYAEKHKTELLPKLSPVQSPLMCTAVYVRKYLHNNDILVGLTPCIAKGDEFRNTGIVKYNVTFRRLDEYLKENHINLPTGRSEFEFSAQRGFDGAFYPIPGGLKDCLEVYAPDLPVTTSEGVQKVYEDFDVYLNSPPDKLPMVFDVLSCEFGCNSGAGARTSFNTFGAYDIMMNAKKWANRRKSKERFHKHIFKTLRLEDFIRTYQNRSISKPPTEAEINEIFKRMEKHTDFERHIDCHACGFKSCRNMALTIHAGNNTVENCVMYEKKHMAKMREDIENQNANLQRYVEQIHTYLQNLTEKVAPISGLAEDNLKKNADIKTNMDALMNDMTSVQSKANGISGRVSEISVGIDEYTKILEKIKSISDQTNILAINASIEAARAGEHGKGFAVVAGEVRSLAVKSASTLKEAEEHTNSILASVSGITSATDAIIEEVSSTQEGVDKTNEAVSVMDDSSRNISSNVADVTSVIEELSDLVASLVSSSSH